MEKIKNPSEWQLGILLVPLVIMMIMVIIMKRMPVWAIVIGALSFASFLGAMTYYCIKQKCYRQLVANYAVVIITILTMIVQFVVI